MAGRSSSSGSKLRFLTDREFEEEAALLLAEYERFGVSVTVPPIPIDDIIEEYLKIAIEFRDLRMEYPEGDVLGAIYFNEKKIAVDNRLVPEDFPAMRGRYRFTLAHELGHWRLHRHLYLRRPDERELFSGIPPKPDLVLRSRHSDPKEFQANRFASCVLMPLEMVRHAWREWRGELEPIYLPDLRADAGSEGTDEIVLENAMRPLAATFHVSPEAMRIRAEGMRMLFRKRETSLFD